MQSPMSMSRLLPLIIATACFGGAGALLLAYLFSDQHARLSSSHCRLVPAKVVGKGKSLDDRNGMQLVAYHIRYSFTFEGQLLQGQGTVDREWYHWLDPGDETPVFVDVSYPQRNFLKIERDYCLARYIKPVCIATIGGLAAMAFFVLRGRRRAADQPPSI